MARPLRIEYHGAAYHISSRSNERRPIGTCGGEEEHDPEEGLDSSYIFMSADGCHHDFVFSADVE